MTDYAPSHVFMLGKTALKQLQVSVVGSLDMLRSYGTYTFEIEHALLLSESRLYFRQRCRFSAHPIANAVCQGTALHWCERA